MPQGFHAEVYAEDFARPRYMLEGPSGEILLADSESGSAGTVWVLADTKKDYKPTERKKLITGLDRPYGLALWKEYLYVGEPAVRQALPL